MFEDQIDGRVLKLLAVSINWLYLKIVMLSHVVVSEGAFMLQRPEGTTVLWAYKGL